MEITSSLTYTGAFYEESVGSISFYIRRESGARIVVFSNTGCEADLQSYGSYININNINIPQKYRSQTSGMMGNFNGIAGDDTTIPREFSINFLYLLFCMHMLSCLCPPLTDYTL